jgi:hypothetical protein
MPEASHRGLNVEVESLTTHIDTCVSFPALLTPCLQKNESPQLEQSTAK